MSDRALNGIVAALACIGLANVCCLFVFGAMALYKYIAS